MSRKPYTSRRKRRAYALVFTLILMLLPIAVFIEIKAPAVIYAMAVCMGKLGKALALVAKK